MTPHSLRDGWRGFRRLSPEQRRTVVAALTFLPFIGAMLRLLGFSRCHWLLSSLMAPPPLSPDAPGVLPRAREVARLIQMAASRGPYRATCLPRSMLLWLMLRREGIDTAVRVGVRRKNDRLHAHAWIEYQGRSVNDDDAPDQFAVFDRMTVA